MVRRLLSAFTLAISLFTTQVAAPAGAAQQSLPSKSQWVQDIQQALVGARAYVRRRAAQGGRLALNLDIDNTSIATHYAPGQPVAATLAVVRVARRHGVKIFFNTGRSARQRTHTLRQLRHAGYRVDRLCMRKPGEGLVHSKKRCRRSFVAAGFTLIENIGNHDTDFTGGNYERAYRLPNYGNQLG